MQDLFGIPIGSLAVALIVLVGLGVGVLATLAIRNVVFFRLGIRNAARRKSRSVLIVVGLMLATTIIASALGTGDTMGRTIRSSVLRTLGGSDEWVTVRTAKSSLAVQFDTTTGNDFFDQNVVTKVENALRGSGLVDGIAPAIIDSVAVQDTTSRQTEPRVGVFAADPTQLAGFGNIIGSSGKHLSLANLAPGSVYIDQRAADKLHAHAGDSMFALAGSHVFRVKVADVVDYRGTGTDGPALLMPLRAAQQALGATGKIKQILVSNRGGESSGATLTAAVTRRLEPVLAPLDLEARPVKHDGLKQADDTGKSFMQIFSTFGSFSVAAGILLIFLIFVMLAAERRTEMGVARAIGTRRGHLIETFLFEGAVYDVVAAAIGALLGVAISFAMVTGVGNAFSQTAPSLDIVYSVRWQSLVVAYAIGVLLTLVVVALSAWRVSVVNIVTAIRNLPDPRRRPRRRRSLVTGSVVMLLGLLMTISGRSSSQAMPFMLGVSLMIIGAVPILRALRVGDRAAFSFGGIGIVIVWMLPFSVIEKLVPGSQMNFSLWVVGGLLIVVGAVWTVIYNADLVLGAMTRVLGRIRSFAAVLRISMAYPLRTRLRTGMTLAMFTIVVFNLVVGTTTTGAFLKAFSHVDQYSGGFDVRATTSPLSPIDNMTAALAKTRLAHEVRAVGSQAIIPVGVRQAGAGGKFVDYPLRGLDDGYLANTTYQFASRAPGYTSDRSVWNALRTHTGLAVVDANIVPHRRNWNFGSLTDLKLTGLFAEDRTFDPIRLQIRDPQTGLLSSVTVIGILRDTVPLEAAGVSTGERTLTPYGDRARPTAHYLKLAPGVDPKRFADQMESTFLANGLQADAYKKVVADAVATSVVVDRLIFGFMGLGLIVGVAALGVIAARSVVERRQQIGVMRAIGFQASAVRLEFLLESAMLAITAIVIGSLLGLTMAYNVIDDASRQGNYGHVPFVVPWVSLAVVFVLVMLVALGTTYLPARRASRVYAAEALRYQ